MRNNRFFGREDFLSSLRTEFEKSLITADNPRLVSVIIHGLGGFGKSSIAVEFMYRHLQTFPVILFFYADRQDKLDIQFVQLARLLGFASDDTEIVKSREMTLYWIAHLGNCPSLRFKEIEMLIMIDVNWLIIFDNADDVSLLTQYWPSSAHGSIIITSRNSFTGKGSFAGQGIKLVPFDENEGAEFLLSFLDIFPDISPADKDAAKLISKQFDGLALGLCQAGHFMRNKACLPTKFLDLYPQNCGEIQRLKIPGYTKSVADVWEMSLSILPQDSRDFLDLLAVLDPDSIPIKLFQQYGHNSPFSAFLQDTMRYMKATEALVDQSLIEINLRDETISLHRFFQDSTFQQLKGKKERFEEVFFGITTMINSAIPQDDYLSMKHHDIWDAVETFLAHAEILLGRCSEGIPPLATNALLDLFCKIAG
jgi:hypothetical protein